MITNRRVQTLDEFTIQQMRDFPHATGELAGLLRDLGLAAKRVNVEVNKAGLVDILGDEGSINVQGEEVKKLDVYANNQFMGVLKHGISCAGIGSEEMDDIVVFDDPVSNKSKYVCLFDPLDGSSNIDVNVSIGTIFSIFRRVSELGKPATKEDFLQQGNKQIAAGYVIYGSSTMFVYATRRGVNGFTLDQSIGEYTLSHPDITCPVHRNLIKGGIFMYPATIGKPGGKLRLLYECNPFAFIVEKAGGLATNGKIRILDIQPTELHERTPFFIGSKLMMEEMDKYYLGELKVNKE
ncbi:MAG: fructose-1,6-bisphosphatase [Chitinophagaceae bacterium]|nr:fructose-1,6-bisphosphatase [Chitinophagaceae bacterium]